MLNRMRAAVTGDSAEKGAKGRVDGPPLAAGQSWRLVTSSRW